MMKIIGLLLGVILIYFSQDVVSIINQWIYNGSQKTLIDHKTFTYVLSAIIGVNILFTVMFRKRENHSLLIFTMMSMFCAILVALIFTGYLSNPDEYITIVVFVFVAILTSWSSMGLVYLDNRRKQQAQVIGPNEPINEEPNLHDLSSLNDRLSESDPSSVEPLVTEQMEATPTLTTNEKKELNWNTGSSFPPRSERYKRK